MKDQELVNALRCTSSPGEPIGDCKKCRFYKTEPVPEDLAGKVNLTEWSSCDVDAVGLAAADRIANQSTHILALQKEIAGLRKAVRWVHDGLYLCDPEKNTVCKKAAVKSSVFTPRSRRSRTPGQRRQHRNSTGRGRQGRSAGGATCAASPHAEHRKYAVYHRGWRNC